MGNQKIFSDEVAHGRPNPIKLGGGKALFILELVHHCHARIEIGVLGMDE